MSNADMPAMPQSGIEDSSGGFSDSSDWGGSGLTKRETFCLHMGVAKTGDDELDAIITEGNRNKAAMHAMQGHIAGNSAWTDGLEGGFSLADSAPTAKEAVMYADDLLAALEGKE